MDVLWHYKLDLLSLDLVPLFMVETLVRNTRSHESGSRRALTPLEVDEVKIYQEPNMEVCQEDISEIHVMFVAIMLW